jgi:YD repeat-containing protein
VLAGLAALLAATLAQASLSPTDAGISALPAPVAFPLGALNHTTPYLARLIAGLDDRGFHAFGLEAGPLLGSGSATALDLTGGLGWSASLDGANRLTDTPGGQVFVLGNAPVVTPTDTWSFSYGPGDELDHIDQGSRGGDQLHRILQESDGSLVTLQTGPTGRTLARDGAAFSYDLSCRRIEDDRFTYTWDWRGRQVQVDVKPGSGLHDANGTTLDGHRVLYAYDALGRLARRTHLGPRPQGSTSDDDRTFVDAREYRWEGPSLLAETGLNFELHPIWRATYVPGPVGLDDAAQVRVDSLDPASGDFTASRAYTLLRDELGSVIALNAEQAGGDPSAPKIVARYLYTPYGEAHAETGPELRRAWFDQERTQRAP